MLPPGGFEDFAGAVAQFFLDRGKNGNFTVILILHRSANNTAGIGDKVWNTENASLMQGYFCCTGNRNIGTLQDKPGIQPIYIGFVDNIRSSRGDPDIALDIDDFVAIAFFAILIWLIVTWFPSLTDSQDLVYLLLIGAFIPATTYAGGWITLQGLVLFSMSSIGALVAIPVALFLKFGHEIGLQLQRIVHQISSHVYGSCANADVSVHSALNCARSSDFKTSSTEKY